MSILEGPDFVKSSLALAISLRVIERGVLQNQFSAFLKKMDSKDIIVKFLNSEAKLFCGIELILQAIAVASIKISVESIAESFISEYNRRDDKLRTLSEDAAEFEMEIAKNGPVMAECDSVVKEGLDLYFNTKTKSKKWNFITRSGAVDGNLVGKRVSKILGESSRLPFMS